jgi:hypothetical protein
MVVLDRVFMNASWEAHFPLVTAHSITRIRSDHNPLLEVDTFKDIRSKKFRFEAAWVRQEGFREWMLSKWPDKQKLRGIDYWQKIATRLRRSLRGWNNNWEVI